MSLKEASPSVKESGEDELDMFVNSEFFKNTTSNDEVKYTIQESINVDDIEGHVIRIFKTETNAECRK